MIPEEMSDKDAAQCEDDDAFMARILDDMRGHGFCAVTILAQRDKADDTVFSRADGFGNWWARYGQAKAWVGKVEVKDCQMGCNQ